MKRVFGLALIVSKGGKALRKVVKRIQQGEVFTERIALEKNTAYVFSARVVEGTSFRHNGRETDVWTARRFDDEDRQTALWAVALDEGEHQVQVGVKWVDHSPSITDVEVELTFLEPSRADMVRKKPAGKRAGARGRATLLRR